MVAIFIIACGQEAPPPPPPATMPTALQPGVQVPGAQAPGAQAPGAQAPGAQAPTAEEPVAQAAPPQLPGIVYASAEPQHGGVRKLGGEYMVELATGAEGKVDAYIQKHEGDVPSFEDVQVEMRVKPKKTAEGKQEPPQDVILYPKDGKLQGTVAGLPEGAYDVVFKIYDIKDDKLSKIKFKKMKFEPLETELVPQHEGEVKLVDKTKMEIVREGSKVKIWLRNLKDKQLKPKKAKVTQMVVNLDDGSKEELEVVPKDDHFEAVVKGPINPKQFKIMMANLKVKGKEYPKLRVPRVVAQPVLVKKGMKSESQPMTTGEAEKKEGPSKMKGAIGTMSIGKKPDKKTENKPVNETVNKKPTKKGSVSKAKPASPAGKPTSGKTSKKTKKGSMSKVKKVK